MSSVAHPSLSFCAGVDFHIFAKNWSDAIITLTTYEPRSEKTGLRGFRPEGTQTGLYSHTRWLEA